MGKVFHETPLLDDQRHILRQLMQELGEDDYSALLLAGDIYDRSIPPVEAVEAFSGFLAETKERFPDVAVFVIPGNHDSAQRLSFAADILRRQRIYITGAAESAFAPTIISQKNEKVAFFSLPFLAPRSVRGSAATRKPESGENSENSGNGGRDGAPDDGDALFSQADMMEEASRRFHAVLQTPELQGIPSVLLAHCFTLGGAESSSERVFTGTAEKVPPRLFRDFTYTALGHLHKFQRVADNIYYSGSPLAYAFDEAGADKFFLKVEIDSAAAGFPVRVSPIKTTPKRRVVRLRGEFEDFARSPRFSEYSNDYIEIELTDKSVRTNPMQTLKRTFPNLLSVKQTFRRGDGGDAPVNIQTGENENPVDNFEAFEKYIYADSPQSEEEARAKKEVFARIVGECTAQEIAGNDEA